MYHAVETTSLCFIWWSLLLYEMEMIFFLLKILANWMEFEIKYTTRVNNQRQQNNNKIIPLSLNLEIYKYVLQAMPLSRDIRRYPIIRNWKEMSICACTGNKKDKRWRKIKTNTCDPKWTLSEYIHVHP